MERVLRTIGLFVWAIPTLALASGYLLVWLSPSRFDQDRPRQLFLLLLMEFLVIHSTGLFMTIMAKRGKGRPGLVSLAGYLVFYGLFASALGFTFNDYVMPLMFLALLLFRIPQFRHSTDQAALEWAVSTMAYIACLVGYSLVSLPRFGITPEAVAQMRLPGRGTLVESPQIVFGAGFTYFSIVAVYQILSGFTAKRSTPIPGS